MEKKTILVVEDEKALQEAIRIKLENSGFNVVTARTVEQTLDLFEELEKVDAVWLDHYLLGKENGLDLVTKLKENGGKWAEIPIFVVSNTASPDKVQSYIRFGVNKYYTKSDHKLKEIIGDITQFLQKGEEKNEA